MDSDDLEISIDMLLGVALELEEDACFSFLLISSLDEA